MRWCFYRYHVVDPVYFRRDMRVTIQQIGFSRTIAAAASTARVVSSTALDQARS